MGLKKKEKRAIESKKERKKKKGENKCIAQIGYLKNNF